MLARMNSVLVVSVVVLALAGVARATDTLVSYWPMTDNTSSSVVTNTVNSSLDGTLYGGATSTTLQNTSTYSVAGKFGTALNLGTLSNTNIPITGSAVQTLMGGLTNCTLSLWETGFYNSGSGGEPVCSFGGINTPTNGSLDSRIQLQFANDDHTTLGAYENVGTSKGPTTGTLSWTASSWYNVTFVMASSTMSIYVNGVSIAMTSSSTYNPSQVGQYEIMFAGLPGNSYGKFPYTLDDVSLFNTNLSAAEIGAITNLGNSALNYAAGAVDKLFVAFGGQTSTNVNGTNWYYEASGAGADGVVTSLAGGNYSVGLGGGAGMTTVGVPEPGTLALLVAGLAGLLAYAWRKRR